MIYDVRFHSWLGPPEPKSEIGVPARRHVSVPSADEREMFAMCIDASRPGLKCTRGSRARGPLIT